MYCMHKYPTMFFSYRFLLIFFELNFCASERLFLRHCIKAIKNIHPFRTLPIELLIKYLKMR